MPSNTQQISATRRILDSLKDKAIIYRRWLRRLEQGAMETVAISNSEVEMLEESVIDIARRITNEDPPKYLWERSHPFCSSNEEKGKDDWLEQSYEYFKWFLIWIEKTRVYLDYLEGYVDVTGDPTSFVKTGSMLDQQQHASSNHPYQVALSFAGEDRVLAKQLAELLRQADVKVFYDEYEQANLWGKDLYVHLSDVYRNKAKYCVVFLSQHYARKLWTNHERRSAQERSFRESEEYILPVRLDDTEVPGILDTTGYLDLRLVPIQVVFESLAEKLKKREP